MANHRTDKCKFSSRFGGGFVTAAQLVTEEFCCLLAKSDLPDKFWNLDKWRKQFVRFVAESNALLRIFPPEVIIKVLRNPKLKYIKSLQSPKLLEFLEQEGKYQENKKEIPQPPDFLPSCEIELPRVPPPSKSLFDKLL